MSQITPTDRTRVRRKPDRANYDRETIYGILDQAFVCSVGFISDGLPVVVPTNYVRVGDKLFLHGSVASRLMKTLGSGARFCLNVTLLDGIVFSPTATGHSVNYRSVVVMGKAEQVEGIEAKRAAMRDFVEYVLRGRWATVRPPSEQELNGTMVLAVPLVEASAKIRTGFAVDSDGEYASGAWTGVLPFKWTPGEPVRDPRGNPSVPVPENVQNYKRPQ
ncbi:MAG: pyridoxamine 5'-phosphate oxidase family protein [Candidatus Acidiferrum sp.]